MAVLRPAGRGVHGEVTSAGDDTAVRTLPKDKAVTALLCGNDTLALGAMAAWRRAGRMVGSAAWRSLTTAIRRLTTPIERHVPPQTQPGDPR